MRVAESLAGSGQKAARQVPACCALVVTTWCRGVQVWGQVQHHGKGHMARDLAAEAGKLKPLEVQCQHVWRLLDARAALCAHKLFVCGAAVLVVAIKDLLGTVVGQRLKHIVRPAPTSQTSEGKS